MKCSLRFARQVTRFASSVEWSSRSLLILTHWQFPFGPFITHAQITP
jgi:hypothetical protein